MAEIDFKFDDGIATVTLCRPKQLNALSGSLLEELDKTVARLEQDDAVHGAIITGEGRAFVVGADIAEIAELDSERGLEFAKRGQAVFSRIENLDKPVIAAVNGFALGGGCELAMACHLRIGSTRVRFGQPEVKLGILPGFGGTQRLPRLIGRGLATEILLSGRQVTAEEAVRIGLLSEVVEPERLLDRAWELLAEILSNGPAAVAATLAAIREGLQKPLDEGLVLEAALFSKLCGTAEMREGTGAFLEKRVPRFR
ncbi:MAG: enoyl-CoA hydratase-related protein [Myxococcota bacterium]